ncbi:hypothetical protein KC842_03030 [Candidatus Nomurabacteria bacterium]|nr:hypothetical protein [Candidatus Nomurabacteria bacterium]
MKKYKKSTTVLFSIVYLGVAVGFFVGLLLVINMITKDTLRTNAELTQKTKLRDKISELQIELDRSKEDRRQIESFFIDKDNIIPALNKIEEIGPLTNTDVLITSIALSEKEIIDPNNPVKKDEEPPKGYELVVSLTSEGEFGDVIHFLEALENISYSFVIDRIRFDIVSEAGSQVDEVTIPNTIWLLETTIRITSVVE